MLLGLVYYLRERETIGKLLCFFHQKLTTAYLTRGFLLHNQRLSMSLYARLFPVLFVTLSLD
jgi:hypothetical protein